MLKNLGQLRDRIDKWNAEADALIGDHGSFNAARSQRVPEDSEWPFAVVNGDRGHGRQSKSERRGRRTA